MDDFLDLSSKEAGGGGGGGPSSSSGGGGGISSSSPSSSILGRSSTSSRVLNLGLSCCSISNFCAADWRLAKADSTKGCPFTSTSLDLRLKRKAIARRLAKKALKSRPAAEQEPVRARFVQRLLAALAGAGGNLGTARMPTE